MKPAAALLAALALGVAAGGCGSDDDGEAPNPTVATIPTSGGQPETQTSPSGDTTTGEETETDSGDDGDSGGY